MEVKIFCWKLVFLSKDRVTKVCNGKNTNLLIPPLLQRTTGQNQNNQGFSFDSGRDLWKGDVADFVSALAFVLKYLAK